MVPDYKYVVEQCKKAYPAEWKNAHTGNEHTEDFIRLLAVQLHDLDKRFGLNGKRGDPDDISDDAVNFKGEGADTDPTNGNSPVTIIDVIAAAGSPQASPSWVIVTDAANPTKGAWVDPTNVVEPPAPPPPTFAPYPGDQVFNQLGRILEQDYKTYSGELNGGCGVWFGRATYDYLVGNVPSMDAAIQKHRPDWLKILGGS